MKTRILVIILLLLFLAIVVTRKDDRFVDIILSIVNPIKQTYTNVTREVENKSHSYIYQKEYIEKLGKENKFLRKRLLEQKHYIRQVSDLYRKIPSLERIPRKSVEIVQTISYVKLNSFSQIILTKPHGLANRADRLYGLVQGNVAAGVARVKGDNLYGALTSNELCHFSVYIGEKRAPGIAQGVNTNKMLVKFIPKWSDIKVGDEVLTSGLDSIFFAYIPVGVVDKVEVESSYKVAHIKTYADVLHPDYFYLITDPAVTLSGRFDGNIVPDCKQAVANALLRVSGDLNQTAYDLNQSTSDLNQTETDYNQTLESMQDPMISSIPSVLPKEPESIIQTQEEEVDPEHLETPAEEVFKPKPENKKRYRKPKVENLDLF